MERAVFLDRDGVLTQVFVRDGRPYAATSLDNFRLVPNVVEATASLKAAGFKLIVVTNQPDIATGRLRAEVLDEMHRRLRSWLPLDAVKFCPHNDVDNCRCRKPKPGMLLEAAAEWQIDLADSFMIGDRWRDVCAGNSAGCKSIFLDCNYQEQLLSLPDFTAKSLAEAAELILDLKLRSLDARRQTRKNS